MGENICQKNARYKKLSTNTIDQNGIERYTDKGKADAFVTTMKMLSAYRQTLNTTKTLKRTENKNRNDQQTNKKRQNIFAY